MADVSIGGALPVGDADGLSAIASALIAEPARRRVIISIIDVQKVTTSTDDGTKRATVRMRRAEVVLPQDLPAAEKLMRRALEQRTGQTTLPLDLEDEISDVFSGLDLDAAGGEEEP